MKRTTGRMLFPFIMHHAIIKKTRRHLWRKSNISVQNVEIHSMKAINFRQQVVIFQRFLISRTRNSSQYLVPDAVTRNCISRKQMRDGISSISLSVIRKAVTDDSKTDLPVTAFYFPNH